MVDSIQPGSLVYFLAVDGSTDLNHVQKDNIMSKGQNQKRDSKKEPAKTMKEKKAAKREKKEQKTNSGVFDLEVKK
jgi:hypothetical protein